MARRQNGTGTVYQRSDGYWIGRIDSGFTESGKRRRSTVSAKTEAQAKRKLRELTKRLNAGDATADKRMTVKRFADLWLEVKVTRLSPKGYNAAKSPITKWIVPTIGHRRLNELTPAHVRQVERAQREAGLKGSTAAATQRTLVNMLRDARREGYAVANSVIEARKPETAPSDRMPPPFEDVVRIMELAATRPYGLRWWLALLYGWRQNEVLGLVADSIEVTGKHVFVDWQLQALPYLDRKNKALGFRVPDEHESKHLVDSWHLVRPKSRAGVRTAPMLDELVPWLLQAREDAERNPYRLLFPAADGRPRNDKVDRREWWALQEELGITHPTRTRVNEEDETVPAGYHVHECRNVAASRLRESGVDDLAITSLMGHTSINTSRLYMAVNDAGKAAAISSVSKGLPAAPVKANKSRRSPR